MTRGTCIGLALLAFAGCGDDDTTTTDATGTTPTDTADGTADADAVTGDTAATSSDTDTVATQEHRILVTSTAITGRQGDVLLITGPGGGSRACAMIDADPFTLTAAALTDAPQSGDPCADGRPETRFPDGSHTVTAAVYAPGSQTPLATTVAVAQVAGADATVQLDGASLSAGATVGSPGRILLATTDIAGRQGQVLLVTTDGGRVCAQIDADPWALTATAMTEPPSGGNPCDGVTAEATFAGGARVVTAAIFTPGSQTPEASTTAVAAVDGDVTVTIEGSALSSE